MAGVHFHLLKSLGTLVAGGKNKLILYCGCVRVRVLSINIGNEIGLTFVSIVI